MIGLAGRVVDVTMLVLTPDPPEIKVRSNGVGSAGCPLRGVQNGFLSSMFLYEEHGSAQLFSVAFLCVCGTGLSNWRRWLGRDGVGLGSSPTAIALFLW